MKMIFLFLIFLIVSCSHKITKNGGGLEFDEATWGYLAPEEHYLYAHSVVSREQRDPPDISLVKLKALPDFKVQRIGIVVFESIIQPTRSGLSADNNAYLTTRGKQKIHQELYNFWISNLKKLMPSIETVSSKELKKTKAFHEYGLLQEDYILGDNLEMNDQDAFYLTPGKNISAVTTLNGPGMRDMSLVLVPASDLMMGPKFSEHQKHWVNEICQELDLDAVIVTQFKGEWLPEKTDKRTQEKRKEKMSLSIQSSILYPFGKYQSLLLKSGLNNQQISKVNIPLGTYEVKANFPVLVTVPDDHKNFEILKKNILEPFKEKSQWLSYLVLVRIAADIEEL